MLRFEKYGLKSQRERTKQKGKKMKKFVLLVAILISNSAVADYYKTTVNSCDGEKMRAALDRATVENRAVITVVECEDNDTTVETTTQTRTETWNDNYTYVPVYNTCGYCGEPMEAVVRRDYFVRETVQQYRPVVRYVPAGAYTRVRRVRGAY